MSEGHVAVEVREKIRQDLALQEGRTGIPVRQLLSWWGISRSTFYGWGTQITTPSRRYNPATVLPEEEQAVIEFRARHREVGYRKLCWLMNDAGVVASRAAPTEVCSAFQATNGSVPRLNNGVRPERFHPGSEYGSALATDGGSLSAVRCTG